MFRHFTVVWATVALIGGAARIAAAQTPPELIAYPNLVLYNGKVITVDAQFTVAQAVALRDGRILAVGTNDQITRLVGPSTRSIDLQGRTVVPGFIDSDGDNAFAGGDLYKDTMVNGKVGAKVRGDSVAEMLKQVTALVGEAAPGSPVWVRMADEWIAELSKLTPLRRRSRGPMIPAPLRAPRAAAARGTRLRRARLWRA